MLFTLFYHQSISYLGNAVWKKPPRYLTFTHMTGLTPEYEVMGIRVPSNSHFSTMDFAPIKYTPYILARSCLNHSQESEK